MSSRPNQNVIERAPDGLEPLLALGEVPNFLESIDLGSAAKISAWRLSGVKTRDEHNGLTRQSRRICSVGFHFPPCRGSYGAVQRLGRVETPDSGHTQAARRLQALHLS